MKKIILLFLFLSLALTLYPQVTLRYEENETLTYNEIIRAYQYLDKKFDKARLIEAGTTDVGKPLHLFILSGKQIFDPAAIAASDMPVIFINNGIHPGEPEGIDASIQLSMDILTNTNDMGRYLDKVILCIIPVYNVGGILDRSAYHRANQETPPETGFRGNGQHLDLNRDFIKADSRNARSLERVFRLIDPLVFLDTHTTNGSDHQYTITLIPTMYQKMEPAMGKFFHKTMVPGLFDYMEHTPYEMIPYVNSIRGTPDMGIAAFNDLPRFSTGYAALFNTFAFMTENHVYKPFRDRVKSVYYFMKGLTEFTAAHGDEMLLLKKNAEKETAKQKKYVLTWKTDTSRYEMIPFKGYERREYTGVVTGMPYRWYDRNKPYTKEIRYYDHFAPVMTAKAPDYYIIPQAWQKAIERLHINGIRMLRLLRDTTVTLQVPYITSMDPGSRPYNGHYQHRNVKYRLEERSVRLYRGDYIIPVDQAGNKYIVQTLEPDAPDSYFSWNFFDPILDRREYFSPSTFEERAADVLDQDPELRKAFEEKKKQDSTFAASRYRQLSYIYNHSPWLEDSWMRVPVYRLNGSLTLPTEEDKDTEDISTYLNRYFNRQLNR